MSPCVTHAHISLINNELKPDCFGAIIEGGLRPNDKPTLAVVAAGAAVLTPGKLKLLNEGFPPNPVKHK